MTQSEVHIQRALFPRSEQYPGRFVFSRTIPQAPSCPWRRTDEERGRERHRLDERGFDALLFTTTCAFYRDGLEPSILRYSRLFCFIDNRVNQTFG